jgi:adenylate cyclase
MMRRIRIGGAARRNLAILGIAIGAALIAGLLQVQESQALYPGGPLHAMESAAQDAVLRSRNPDRYGTSVGRDPRGLITLIAIDERSLAQLGLFRSWPRGYYAQVIDQLMATPPRVVLLDIGFFEPAPDDAALANAIERGRAQRPAVPVVLAAAGGGDATRGPDGAVSFGSGLEPLPGLAADADIGATDVLPDDRGEVRSMPLLLDLGTDQRPTLGLLAATRYLRRPAYVDSRPDPTTLVVAGRQIPVDASSAVRVNYFGPPSDPGLPASTFRTLSFVDVLRGQVDPTTWRDGIVFIGLLGAAGFADDYWTPVSDQGHKMAGVEIHANVAATLLSTQFLRDAPLAADLAVVVLLALIVGGLAANLGILSASLAALAVAAGYVLANLAILDQSGLQLALATPLLAAAMTFAGSTTYRVAIEQRQARALQSALASVIPPGVAQEIARDPRRVHIGGERRTLTVMFTDLKDFTGFSETLEPQVLSRVLTEYLDAMTSVVFRFGGTLDKFVGDAVMSFWNAPLDDPRHAWHACEAALAMQAELVRLGDVWQSQGLPCQSMRVGIHTGLASVGNMGSTRRFAYTAVGDTVNLASRLESLNNEYGTRICISQQTLDAVGSEHDLIVRHLDLVVVKGKRQAVPVLELIDPALKAQYAATLDLFERGLNLYNAQHFRAAAELFAEANRAAPNGHDPPSAMYADRCRELAQSPPGPTWDRVYVMKHK